MSARKARKNPYHQHLVDVGFVRHRYSVGPGYGGKDRAGPPTWRKFSPMAGYQNRGEVLPGDWRSIEKIKRGWVCYIGMPSFRAWASPPFKDSTSALVYAELNNWGRS